MQIGRILFSVAAVALSAGAAPAATLETVRERGQLHCALTSEQTGFVERGVDGGWRGFDVAMCRAVAAAVLDDPRAVRFIADPGPDPAEGMRAGEIDMLIGPITWSFDSDVGRGLEFAAISYRDGQGFMIRRNSGITAARDLSESTICVEYDSRHEGDLRDYFGDALAEEPVAVSSTSAARRGYLAGDCAVYTADTAMLAAMRSSFDQPAEHVILPEVISKAPRGPVIRDDDPRWREVVRWTVNALIAAEELGVSTDTIDTLVETAEAPEIRRLLGVAGDFGARMDLDPDWARRAVAAVGNYGEIFAGTVGENTTIGLARGLNAQWVDGGLLYALPFR